MSIILTITKKYLVFPVNTKTASKKVLIRENGALLFDFDCKLDLRQPEFSAYIDVSRFIGRTVEIGVSPEMPISVEQADEMRLNGLWREELRPQIHFTVKNGWNNDPNGLIYFAGQYHMFYQYNPCSPEWGNMHWGHAVSEDLLHWEELDCALFPDEWGTMYSGSAIADTENVSGLGEEGGDVPMLLYYTAAGGQNLLSDGRRRTQCMAYSLDGGKTFVKYEKNPVVGHIEGGNRDPKVVWVSEIERYIMVIYLAEDRYLMLQSHDLLNWSKFQTITLHADSECPDLYPLMCGGEKRWVFSGALDIYLVGHFTPQAFIPDSEESRLTYSKISYAGQSFSGLPDGRAVRICWDKLKIPAARFSQQMSVPMEMRLEQLEHKYYLCAAPISELDALRREGETRDSFILQAPLSLEVGCRPVDLTLQMPYDAAARLSFDLFGVPLICDMTRNQLSFKDIKMPLSAEKKQLELRIILDRCSVEVFADGGRFCFTGELFCDYNLPRIILSANQPLRVDRLSWYALESVHQETEQV